MRIITNELVERFEMHLYEEEKSGNTIEKYMRDIRFFREWLCGNELDKPAVLEYKKLLCKKYALQSVNSMLSSLNALFVFLNWYDFKVKTLKSQRRIYTDKSKELTKAEYERLLKAARKNGSERLYYLMQTIASTGLRISELQYVTCEAVNSRQAVINCKGKIRTVFLPEQLCKMLKSYIRRCNIKSGSVFVTRNGKPLNRSNIWSEMKKLCESAGVEKSKVFPHNLRHLFARTFYAIKKDIVRLADILGHSSVNTTRIYTMESGDSHRRLLERMKLLRC